jgi:hypothetical protein
MLDGHGGLVDRVVVRGVVEVYAVLDFDERVDCNVELRDDALSSC